MVIPSRVLLAIGMAGTLLLATGCNDTDKAQPTLAAKWQATAGADLNCPGQTSMRPGWPQTYDITGSGSIYSFVDLICATSHPATAPDQVEIFKGTSRSTRVAKLSSVVAARGQQLFLAHGCIYFTGHRAVVIGQMRPDGDPDAPPTVFVAIVTTAVGSQFRTAAPVPLSSGVGLPPGCG